MTTALKELSRISHAKSSMSDVIEVKSKVSWRQLALFSFSTHHSPIIELNF